MRRIVRTSALGRLLPVASERIRFRDRQQSGQLQPFDLMNANVQLSQVVIELPFATSQGYCINQGRIALETTGKMR